MNIFKLFSIFIRNPTYKGFSERRLFVKVGNLVYFRFRSLKFFIPILHGQLQKKEGKVLRVTIREALRESTGKVDYFFVSKIES